MQTPNYEAARRGMSHTSRLPIYECGADGCGNARRNDFRLRRLYLTFLSSSNPLTRLSACLSKVVFNHPNHPRMLQIVVAATPNLAGTTQRLCGGAIINLRCNSEINRLIDCRLDSIAKALNFSCFCESPCCHSGRSPPPLPFSREFLRLTLTLS